MIKAHPNKDGSFTIRMDVPERHGIKQIADAFRITDADAVVAAMNRGLDSIGKQIKKIDANKEFGPLSDDSDDGGE